MNKTRRFYVYRLFDQNGETQYIGKGTGRRLHNQKVRHGIDGEVLKTFSRECDAYEFETRLIADLKPSLNKCAGGGGPLTRKPTPRRFKWQIEIEREGSRRYAAKFLITRLNESNIAKFGFSKVDLNRLREVANGPRC